MNLACRGNSLDLRSHSAGDDSAVTLAQCASRPRNFRENAEMTRVLPAIAAATAIVCFVSLAPNRAEAITLPAPAAMADAIGGPAEAVAYVCRRWCGRYGCTRRCWWTGPRYYYRPYYRPYRYYRW
jgi:hypothetical protein